MKKMLVITGCQECHHFDANWIKCDLFWDKEESAKAIDTWPNSLGNYPIPANCPLPDAKEEPPR